MKAVTAILFTVLYTVFSCFGITGIAAPTCNYSTCKNTVLSSEARGELNTDNVPNGCSHKPAITAHVIEKQTSNKSGSGNKYLPLSGLIPQTHIIGNIRIPDSNELYSKAVTQTSCPLFIKHCVLLI
jgi:hypothetical protein